MANDLDQTLNRPRGFSSEFRNGCSATALEAGSSSSGAEKLGKIPNLPDELILVILLTTARSSPAPVATTTLASCSLVCHQWHRLANPILYKSPMINVGSKQRTISFLNRLADDLLEYGLDVMDSTKREPRPSSLIGQMRRLMFFGEGRWRHRASYDSRSLVADRSTLHEILNRLWCTKIESLVFVELPFTTPFHRPLVNRYPMTLSTLILLTPLSHFELLFMLRNLPSLAHLCIGSHDDTSSAPAEHHTLFSREQLPSSNLRSFGIAARTLETWLKTGMPWYESILNLVVVPSVQTITTLHIELADEDDERHLLSVLGNSPPPQEAQSPPLSSGPTRLFKLETVFLRGFSAVLMTESLSRLEGVQKLCLSSIYGTALRCPNLPALDQADHLPTALHSDRSNRRSDPVDNPGLLIPAGRLSVRNLVWQSIPGSIQELSIEITRLPDHGPWTKRAADQLTRTLTCLIRSGQCPHLRKLGSLLAERSFPFGIYGSHRNDPPLVDFVQAAASSGISLAPSFWNDSFVIHPSGANWYL